MEDAILNTVSYLEDVDFALVFQAIGIGFMLFWLVVLGWVAFDAAERFSSIWARILSFILVLMFPIFGLFIYLIIRPKATREEEKWFDLEHRFLKFEAEGLEDCPGCGFELMPNFIYCPDCGYELRKKCESCEVYLDPYWGVCPFCGTQQDLKEKFAEDLYLAGDIGEEIPKRGAKKKAIAIPEEPALDVATTAVTAATAVATTASVKTSATAAKPAAKPAKRKKRKKVLGKGKVKEYFEKTMLTMDGFVKYVGNLPLKVVNGSKSRKK